MFIRDVDYNPNKPNMLITSGNDRQIKIWDLRYIETRREQNNRTNKYTNTPSKILFGHSHWVYCAKYNPFHDQLIIR
jgi:WD40 repeat protein